MLIFKMNVTEQHIRRLQDMAQTMLAHTKTRFLSAVSANLWPCALMLAIKTHNNMLRLEDCVLPIELFSKVDVLPKLKNFHHFGCPACVLNDKQASGKKGPKWNLRGMLGVCLGVSPQHAKSVSLTLNLHTGCV